MTITLYHNPRCSKSRQTLDLLQQHGIEPAIVRYLDNPPTPDDILGLAKACTLGVAELIRTGETAYKEAREELATANDDALAAWLGQHPAALQRPIVIDDSRGIGVVGRPPENVLKLID